MNELERNLRDQSRELERNISEDDIQRLRKARASAIAKSGARLFRPSYWIGAGTACAITFAVLLFPMADPSSNVSPSVIAEYALSSDAEVMEDLEFYAWLASTDEI